MRSDAARVKDGLMSPATLLFYQKKTRLLELSWGPDTLLIDVTAETINAWVLRRLTQVSRLSVTKELTTLRQVLDTARQAGLYHLDPRAVLPLRWKTGYTPGDRWITMPQADALLLELKPAHAAMVAFALGFAASPGPTERARWEDWDGATMLLRDTKNAHRWRRVPVLRHAERFTSQALAYLEQHEHFPGWRDQYRHFTLRPACKRAGIEPIVLTDCRRSACHWMLHAGMPEHVAARYMGHASSTMVRRVYGRATSGEALVELVGEFGI